MYYENIAELSRVAGPYLIDISQNTAKALTSCQTALGAWVATDEFLHAATAARSLKTTYDISQMPSNQQTLQNKLSQSSVKKYAYCFFVTEAMRLGAPVHARVAVEAMIRASTLMGYSLLLYAEVGFEEQPTDVKVAAPEPTDFAKKKVNLVEASSFVLTSIIASLAEDVLTGLPPGVHLVGQAAYLIGTTLMIGKIALPIYQNWVNITPVMKSAFSKTYQTLPGKSAIARALKSIGKGMVKGCKKLAATTKMVCAKAARTVSKIPTLVTTAFARKSRYRRPLPEIRYFVA